MIKLSGINKKYDNVDSIFSLENINLNINRGEIFGIVGRSGTGKSTLLNLISGIVKQDSGTIEINGVDTNTLSENDHRLARQKIGFIFQNFNLLSNLTVAENIALPLKIQGVKKNQRNQLVKELLTFIELSDKKDDYPHMISGGQKQRVGIARALITNPNLILCDEITASLDQETSYKILDLLQKINKEKQITIVFVSHDLFSVKRICKRAAILNNGVLQEVINVNNLEGSDIDLNIKAFLTSKGIDYEY